MELQPSEGENTATEMTTQVTHKDETPEKNAKHIKLSYKTANIMADHRISLVQC